jgi:hypothetical protein
MSIEDKHALDLAYSAAANATVITREIMHLDDDGTHRIWMDHVHDISAAAVTLAGIEKGLGPSLWEDTYMDWETCITTIAKFYLDNQRIPDTAQIMNIIKTGNP